MSWEIELSDEVAAWYLGLSAKDAGVADRVFDLLVERGNQLRMPHSRSLGEGLFELRFTCEGVARRVTYTFDPERQVFALTTFRKQRQNEAREVGRAHRALWDHRGNDRKGR